MTAAKMTPRKHSRPHPLMILALTLSVTLATLACGGMGVTGRYISEKNPREYLELNDGTFFIQQGSMGSRTADRPVRSS